ncbi:MAG TPA: hypothetical protein VMG82_00530 [Candidatus Sulfotelmatobacter sp.]|nr:hypothetical protein [Candidatus Sulfotelmatobacter sp.]
MSRSLSQPDGVLTLVVEVPEVQEIKKTRNEEMSAPTAMRQYRDLPRITIAALTVTANLLFHG